MLDLDLSLECVSALGVAVPFSPLSTAPAAWYDPSDLTTLWQDSARTTPVTAHGDPVGAIDDKSGNARHLLQATAGFRPLYQSDVSGKYLLFDGSDDRMTALFALSQPWDRMSAIRQISWGANRTLFNNGNTGTAGILLNRTSTPRIALNDGSAITCENAGLAVGTNGVVLERHNGASSSITVDNGAAATGSPGTAAIAGMSIGARSDGLAGSFANMRFYGAILKSGTLTDPQIALLKTWLGAKAGLSL